MSRKSSTSQDDLSPSECRSLLFNVVKSYLSDFQHEPDFASTSYEWKRRIDSLHDTNPHTSFLVYPSDESETSLSYSTVPRQYLETNQRSTDRVPHKGKRINKTERKHLHSTERKAARRIAGTSVIKLKHAKFLPNDDTDNYYVSKYDDPSPTDPNFKRSRETSYFQSDKRPNLYIALVDHTPERSSQLTCIEVVALQNRLQNHICLRFYSFTRAFEIRYESGSDQTVTENNCSVVEAERLAFNLPERLSLENSDRVSSPTFSDSVSVRRPILHWTTLASKRLRRYDYIPVFNLEGTLSARVRDTKCDHTCVEWWKYFHQNALDLIWSWKHLITVFAYVRTT